MIKTLGFFCLVTLLLSGCSKPAQTPARDKHGKLPQDYIPAYYETMNKNDLKAYKALISKGKYKKIITQNGILKKDDPSRLLDYALKNFKKTQSYKIQPQRCRFWKTNAPKVFSVGVLAKLSDGSMLNDEVCFKKFNDEWKITDKLNGE